MTPALVQPTTELPTARVVLASQSPRRRELLGALLEGFAADHRLAVHLELLSPSSPAEAESLEALEAVRAGEPPLAYVVRVARAKATAGWARLMSTQTSRGPGPTSTWLMASDTTVSVGSEILGKPRDADDFRRMMRLLSGRSHEVRTAVCLQLDGHCLEAVSTNTVHMAALPEAWTSRLAQSSEPYDKAGGYAIQGEAGVHIQRIEGSPSGIVGLPLHETLQLLQQAMALTFPALPTSPTLPQFPTA